MPTAQSLLAVQQVYIAYYGRPADPAGLEFWATRLDEAGGNFNQIIEAFANSPEATSLYGDNQTGTDLINAIYQNLLGRPAEAEGLEFWLGTLNTGRFNQDNIVLAILQSAREGDADLVNNKIALANEFTQGVLQGNVPYAGDAAAAVARTLMQLVSAEQGGGVGPGLLDAYFAASRVASLTPAVFDGLIEQGVLIDPSIVRPGFNLDGSEINPPPVVIPPIFLPSVTQQTFQPGLGGDTLTFSNAVIETLVVKGNGNVLASTEMQRAASQSASASLLELQQMHKEGTTAETLADLIAKTELSLGSAKEEVANLTEKLSTNASAQTDATAAVDAIKKNLAMFAAEEVEQKAAIMKSDSILKDATTATTKATDAQTKAGLAVVDAGSAVEAAKGKVTDADKAAETAADALIKAKEAVGLQKTEITALEVKVKDADADAVTQKGKVDTLAASVEKAELEVADAQTEVNGLTTAVNDAKAKAELSLQAADASIIQATFEKLSIVIAAKPNSKNEYEDFDAEFKGDNGSDKIKIKVKVDDNDGIDKIGGKIAAELNMLAPGKLKASFVQGTNKVQVEWLIAGNQNDLELSKDTKKDYTTTTEQGIDAKPANPALDAIAKADAEAVVKAEGELAAAQTKLSKLQAQLTTDKATLSTDQFKLVELQTAVTLAKEEVNKAQTKLLELEMAAKTADTQAELANKALAEAKHAVTKAEADLQKAKDLKAAADADVTQAQATQDSAQKTLDADKTKLVSLLDKITLTTGEQEKADAEVSKLLTEEKGLKTQLDEAGQKVETLNADLEMQQELKDAFASAEGAASDAQQALSMAIDELKSDSYFSIHRGDEADSTWDVVTGFNPNQDKLKLDFNGVLETLDLKGFTLINGVVSSAPPVLSTLPALPFPPSGPSIVVLEFPSTPLHWSDTLLAVVREIGESTAAFAVHGDGNTYVFQGNGVAGLQSSDVFVQLTGVVVGDLAAILAA